MSVEAAVDTYLNQVAYVLLGCESGRLNGPDKGSQYISRLHTPVHPLIYGNAGSWPALRSCRLGLCFAVALLMITASQASQTPWQPPHIR